MNVYEWRNYDREVPPAREIEDSKERASDQIEPKKENDDFILLFEGIASAASHFNNNIDIDSFEQYQ